MGAREILITNHTYALKKNIKGENTYKEKKGDKTLKALSFSCWGNKMSNSSFS